MSSAPMPAAFIGHGSPMNAVERNRYTDAYAYCYAQTHAHTEVSAHPEESSHSAAETLILE